MAETNMGRVVGLVNLLWRACPVLIALVLCGSTDAHAYPSLEFALKRTNTPLFYLDYNADSVPDRSVSYGIATDIGLVGDFDGDTITDFALYRNGTWYIDFFNDTVADRGVIFGSAPNTDAPIVADFNSDGKADIGVYRNNGVWYLDFNLDGAPDRISSFGGVAGDLPVVADFNGDGSVDRAIFRAGRWYIDFDWNSTADAIYGFGGGPTDIPFSADFNNDGMADLGIFRDGVWYIDYDRNGTADQIHLFGASGDRPLFGYFNTANSVFVRAGATGAGNGTQVSPFATVNSALAAGSPPGSIIRIAAGSYPERISVSQKSNLTFQGAGPTATHINPTAGDAFSSFLSSNITLRDIHFASLGPDGATPGRGVVNLGSSMMIEHISTTDNWDHNVIAAQYFPPGIPGSLATLSIDRSSLNRSKIGNGIQLDTGVTATISRSSASENGTNPAAMPPPPAAPGGRGIVLLNNAIATVSFSSINRNYDGGVLITHTGNATLRNNNVSQNGTSGIYYELQSAGEVTGNVAAENGTRGTRGLLGYNGIEIAGLGNSPMTIMGNTLLNNTTNGVFIGGGTVNVINNIFIDNFLGMTVHNLAGDMLSVTIKGNQFDVNNPSHSVAIHTETESPSVFSVTIGGPSMADKNTFRNYGSTPAINYNNSSVPTFCGGGWNIFINSSFPVGNCTSCSP